MAKDYPVATSSYKTAQLPDKIKCIVCKKTKGPLAYSSKRKDEFREEIAKRPASAQKAYISCLTCSGGAQMEFECHGCNNVYGRNRFAKAQLKNPDKAECYKCVQDRLNMEPGAGSDDDDSVGGGDSDDDYDGDDSATQGTTTLGGTRSAFSSNFAGSSGGVALTPSNLSSNAGNSSGGGVGALTGSMASLSTARGLPPHLAKRSPGSVVSAATSGTGASKFAKPVRPTVKLDSDAARRVREYDAEQEREVEVQSSDEDDDDA